MFAYNYVSRRVINNKLLYHILKGKITGWYGIEPSWTRAGPILSVAGLRAIDRMGGML